MHKGSCLCGSVEYELEGDIRPSIACHCTQCRKTSGHFWSATQVPNDCFKITKDDGLKWFRSSEWAKRGFCQNCGSSMFWEMDGKNATSVASGTLDNSNDLKTEKHICMATKGDYYEIADGLPQEEKW
jgi:hypothetical protein